ncbi:MAG: hypothetical protein FJ090_12465 [Deltaproteobacteria bacterium]|nr:hypothetical protein [Deltaproteobacteria bacterium]
MYKLDAKTASEIIAEEAALATLRQYAIEKVLENVPDIDEIDDEESAFNALMEAMYRLRPVGHL